MHVQNSTGEHYTLQPHARDHKNLNIYTEDDNHQPDI